MKPDDWPITSFTLPGERELINVADFKAAFPDLAAPCAICGNRILLAKGRLEPHYAVIGDPHATLCPGSGTDPQKDPQT